MSTSSTHHISRRHGTPRVMSQSATRKAHNCQQKVLSYVLSVGVLWCLVNGVNVFLSIEEPGEPSLFGTLLETNKEGTSDTHERQNTNELIRGKERILDILLDAGVTHIDAETLQQLPTWNDVVRLYGSTPRIYGLESCSRYQSIIPAHDAAVAPAGAFNSGTNLLAELLIANCHIQPRMDHYGAQNRGIRWQVNWGKHTPPELRSNNRTTYGDAKVKNEDLLPAVTIRDPYVWMTSMCRHNYATQWFHVDDHCPNLVPNEIDKKAFVELDYPNHLEKPQHLTNFTLDSDTIPVRVNYLVVTKYHKTLAHMWNDWNNDYFKSADFPFLMVRFEDLMFHAKSVTTQVCHCAGGSLNKGDFKYVVDSAKKGTKQHGSDKTNFIDAMIRYGSNRFRFTNITKEDSDYAQQVLDPKIMDFFGYKHDGQEHDVGTGGEHGNNNYNAMIVVNKDKDAVVEQKQQQQAAAVSETSVKDGDVVLERLRRSGVSESVLNDASIRSQLPTWSQITELFGKEPVIEGLDRCGEFRTNVDALDRHLGAAGMFNTGTNLITMLLKGNCIIPERYEHYGPNATKEQYGMRWQVPWGKHTPAMLRMQHHATKAAAIIKEHVLPIVLIRNPYDWMASTCKHPYTARWPHTQANCPNILHKPQDGREKYNPVSVKYASGFTSNHDSLAHWWNDWYMQYIDAAYPRLIIRFEDVIFFQEQVTEQVCTCAGGILRQDRPFQYLINSAKDGPGHGNDRTGMVDAWIKYGKPKPKRSVFSDSDFRASVDILSKDLMHQFRYQHSPP